MEERARSLLTELGLDASPDLRSMPQSLSAPEGSFAGDSRGGWLSRLSPIANGKKDFIKKAGLDLLNMDILLLRQNAALAELSRRFTPVRVIDPKTLLQSIGSLRDVQKLLQQKGVQNTEVLSDLRRLSASSLLAWMLFCSSLTSQFTDEVWLLCSNALTFAWWKEGLECAMLDRDPVKGLAALQALAYHVDPASQEAFFQQFHNNKLEMQKKGIHTAALIDQLVEVLPISPWCGAATVVRRLYNDKHALGRVEDRGLREVLQALLGNAGDEALRAQLVALLALDKRLDEDQFRLAQIAGHLRGQRAYAELYEDCNRLKRYRWMLDVRALPAQASELARQFLANPQLKAQVTRLLQADGQLSDALSGLAAETVRKTVARLVHHAWGSEAMVWLVGLFLVYATGLFGAVKGAAGRWALEVMRELLLF